MEEKNLTVPLFTPDNVSGTCLKRHFHLDKLLTRSPVFQSRLHLASLNGWHGPYSRVFPSHLPVVG
eukprot:scaffold20287_cov93-Cylindrotheca_fusiformis.AAC.1